MTSARVASFLGALLATPFPAAATSSVVDDPPTTTAPTAPTGNDGPADAPAAALADTAANDRTDTFVDVDGDGVDDALLPPLPAGADDRVGQTVVGRRRDARRVVGSAHVVDAATLERFEVDDVHRALRAAPGVYVRDEDGSGLRPNIGMRGASSDRSAKVTLLEDGVLFAPAPYAAPAAYYFPLTTRVVGIEIWKGPAAIRQGPHTVGGALNLRTRPVPVDGVVGGIDVGTGLVGVDREQNRGHGFVGANAPLATLLPSFVLLPPALGDVTAGFVVEGARVQSEGFKVIDGDADADTGFVRDDLMVKLRLASPLLADVRHSVEVKLGLQREESRETYLGLTDADLRADPDRRYAASADDEMRWLRTQGQVRYGLGTGPFELDVVAYRHDLDRTWRKVNGLRDAPNLHDVLTFADAGANPLYRARLDRLAEVPDDDLAVLVGPNHRTYFAEGLAAVGRLELGDGGVAWLPEQRLELGLRLHRDQIVRDHREEGFFVVGNTFVPDGRGEVTTAQNRASAAALSAYVADEVRFGPAVLAPGVRVEVIDGVFVDDVAGTGEKVSRQVVALPGIGASVDVGAGVALLGGVHRGFSPVAPGQTGDVRAEESTNGELGLRFDAGRTLGLGGELVGFASHYDNIVGECTFSAGCVDDTGAQQNGGAAGVWGAELALRHTLPLRLVRTTDALRLETTFTATQARFLTDFTSSHPLFGRVRAGDELAYVPALQGAFVGGLTVGAVDAGLSVGLASAMRDVPGQAAWSTTTATQWTDPVAVVDATAAVELFPGWRLAVRLDNAFDQRAIVSRRPFGARPGKPRSFLVALEGDLALPATTTR
jgi:Fe(3+) dicitrate transport protein